MVDQKTKDLLEELATVLEKLGWKMSQPAIVPKGKDDIEIIGTVVGKEEFVQEVTFMINEFMKESESPPPPPMEDDEIRISENNHDTDPTIFKKNGRLLN